jgi:hypothetical protein
LIDNQYGPEPGKAPNPLNKKPKLIHSKVTTAEDGISSAEGSGGDESSSGYESSSDDEDSSDDGSSSDNDCSSDNEGVSVYDMILAILEFFHHCEETSKLQRFKMLIEHLREMYSDDIIEKLLGPAID